ncbi:MAG: 4'-phosphopantetheinyl transferase superfamily protein [Deltaproteobacteria bacterium]|nr:4'-phosphopantetheinyl transferase superfamily protein [Deltaproteobacteria bacterium]
MFTNFFPVELSRTIRDTFNSMPCTPVMLRLLPATGNIEPGFLLNSELLQLEKYKLPKRRSEYLTGRICAKLAASSYLQSSLNTPVAMEQIEIFNAGHGRPYITFHSSPSPTVPDISISHSKGYAVAMAAEHRCGIDIQKHEKSLIKVKEKYCTAREYTLLSEIIENGDELLRLALLWSAKEAIQKIFSTEKGLPSFSNIRLQTGEEKDYGNVVFSFSVPANHGRQKSVMIRVAAGTFKDYAIAVSMTKETSDA